MLCGRVVTVRTTRGPLFLFFSMHFPRARDWRTGPTGARTDAWLGVRDHARLQDTSPTPIMASALLLYLFFVGLTALCLALLAQAARWDDASSQGEVNDVTPSQLQRITQRQRR